MVRHNNSDRTREKLQVLFGDCTWPQLKRLLCELDQLLVDRALQEPERCILEERAAARHGKSGAELVGTASLFFDDRRR